MCKSNNTPKVLTKNDFYNAFYSSEIMDTQGNCPIRSLMYGESMDIAAEVAFELYQQSLGNLPPTKSIKICLTDRQDEFQEALKRGFDEDFEVYAGWDKDEFFAVHTTYNEFLIANKTNKSEYKVILETVDGKLYAECECRDFIWRKRTCKHISQVLLHRLFGYQKVRNMEIQTI